MAMKSASRKSKRQFHNALKKILPHLRTQIVKRSDQPKGFVVLPKRWIVERTLAWLSQRAGVPAACLNPPHAPTAFCGRLISRGGQTASSRRGQAARPPRQRQLESRQPVRSVVLS
jgi:transposase